MHRAGVDRAIFLRIRGELSQTPSRAEVVGPAGVVVPVRGRVRVDRHTAHWISRYGLVFIRGAYWRHRCAVGSMLMLMSMRFMTSIR